MIDMIDTHMIHYSLWNILYQLFDLYPFWVTMLYLYIRLFLSVIKHTKKLFSILSVLPPILYSSLCY